MLKRRFTSRFRRDYKRYQRSGRDLSLLHETMELLASRIALPQRWRDHALDGDWSDFRDCHVKGDWVLIYRIQGDTITFVRTGNHAELYD